MLRKIPLHRERTVRISALCFQYCCIAYVHKRVQHMGKLYSGKSIPFHERKNKKFIFGPHLLIKVMWWVERCDWIAIPPHQVKSQNQMDFDQCTFNKRKRERRKCHAHLRWLSWLNISLCAICDVLWCLRHSPGADQDCTGYTRHWCFLETLVGSWKKYSRASQMANIYIYATKHHQHCPSMHHWKHQYNNKCELGEVRYHQGPKRNIALS